MAPTAIGMTIRAGFTDCFFGLNRVRGGKRRCGSSGFSSLAGTAVVIGEVLIAAALDGSWRTRKTAWQLGQAIRLPARIESANRNTASQRGHEHFMTGSWGSKKGFVRVQKN